MRFTQKIKTAAGVTSPDPRTDPADVPRLSTFLAEATLLNAGTAPRTHRVALEGTAGNTATVQFWVLDDAGWGQPQIQPDEYAELKWYEVGAPVACTVGEAVEGPALPEGWIYVQVTVAPANDAVVKIGAAP